MKMNVVEKAVLRLASRNPFYGWLLGRLWRRYDETLPARAAVAVAPLSLVANPAAFADLTPLQQQGVLEHEVNHLLLHHFARRRPGLERWNVAADLAANDAILRGADPGRGAAMLPEGVLLPADYNLPPNQTAEAYYDALTPAQVRQAEARQLTVPMDTHCYWQGTSSLSGAIVERQVQRLSGGFGDKRREAKP